MIGKRWELIDWLVLSVFLVVTLVWSFRPLADVDLGWHLAGGLWILDNRAVPQSDPLAAGGRFWLCYSWLPEVFFAWIYNSFGYRGLQLAQVVAILSSVTFLYWYVRQMHGPGSSDRVESGRLDGRIPELITFSIVLLLVAPVWHLRPQLLSVTLFGVMLALAERRQLRLGYLLPLTILWANVHVYWIASPLIAGVYLVFGPVVRRDLRPVGHGVGICLVLAISGALTPYLFKIYPGLIEYLFFHAEANRLIKEFQPVVPRIGALFWLLLIVVGLLVAEVKEVVRRCSIETILLAVVFLLAAFLRRKYLPLFGLTVTPLLVNAVFPSLGARIWKNKSAAAVTEPTISSSQRLVLAGSILVFFLLAVTSIQIEQPLTDRYRELFDLVADVQRQVPSNGAPVRIANHFDDGGWMELAFYLSRPNGAKASLYKPMIDGRTLVMGQERLKEFGDLYFFPAGENSCSILKQWDPQVFILPKGDRFTLQFYGGEKILPCLSAWSFSEWGQNWVLGLPKSSH